MYITVLPYIIMCGPKYRRKCAMGWNGPVYLMAISYIKILNSIKNINNCVLTVIFPLLLPSSRCAKARRNELLRYFPELDSVL